MPSLAALKQRKKTETVAVTSLGRLLARMALDDALHRDYLDDPEAVIADAGLSQDEADALRSNDWSRVVKLLGPKGRPVPTDPSPASKGQDPPP